MPTLDEMRRWLGGSDVPGLPERVDTDAVAQAENLRRDWETIDVPLRVVEGCDGDDDSGVIAGGVFDPASLESIRDKSKKARDAKRKAVEFEKKAFAASGKYRISKDGDDAWINFGKHRGKKLSEIAVEDLTYCNFIIGGDFPDDLKDVARHCVKVRKEPPSPFEPDDDEAAAVRAAIEKSSTPEAMEKVRSIWYKEPVAKVKVAKKKAVTEFDRLYDDDDEDLDG